MDSLAHEQPATAEIDPGRWRRFVGILGATLVGALAATYLFVLLVDPYDIVPFSLPIERRIVSIDQRYMYPQIVRSRRFDSLVVGTSTGRLIDPTILSESFGTRFANLAMNSMSAWEQQTMVDYFMRRAGAPKVVVFALDHVWCDERADHNRITRYGFPAWLYDDNPWNDYLYLFNADTVEVAGRLVGYWLGLYRERMRYDGFEVFTPPENAYDAVKARSYIWPGGPRDIAFDVPPYKLDEAQRTALLLPALGWLNDILGRLPSSTLKVLAFMPMHVAAQPLPGSRQAAVEQECKDRIAAIARKTGTKLIDYRIPSSITRVDANYWDHGHYRLPIGERIARELGPAAIAGRESSDGSYRIVVP